MGSPIPAPNSLAATMLFGALAGGMGWGIRGQYGHETGAMIAGVLVCLTLTLLVCPGAPAPAVLRAVAWGTVAIGFGGSMTYGQTVGLTHDRELVGNWGALGWGMLGLAIKGGLWIGFAGLFLGMGLGGVRYRARDVALAMAGALVLCAAGIWLLNEPYEPAKRILPKIYFSDDWRWEPAATLKPRREVWGGFLFALAGLTGYAGWRRDGLAVRLAGWGVLGGALGFPLGQCLQAGHAWNLDYFRTGWWANVDPLINWWNFMETTFGATMGAALGAGLWLNRARIRLAEAPAPDLPPTLEGALLAVHVTLLALVEFSSVQFADALYDFGLLLGFLPVVLIAGGRWAPILFLLPITALPICGKTLQNLAYEQPLISPAWGWAWFVVLPLAVTVAAAVKLQRRVETAGSEAGAAVLRPALLLAGWLYFGLNYAFFQFPWPWGPWTARTPNALVYTVCLAGLTWLALRKSPGESPGAAAGNR